MITNFINAFFEPDSPWDKVAQYVEGILRVNEEYPRGREYGNKKGWNIEN